MLSLLRAMRTGDGVPPIEVHQPPGLQDYRYALRDGFHRFYASAAIGFRCIPIKVLPYFDIIAG